MLRILFTLTLISGFAAPAHANISADEIVNTQVRDVTNEYLSVSGERTTIASAATGAATPAPTASPDDGSTSAGGSTLGSILSGLTGSQSSQVSLDQIITLGTKIWDFIISNRPNAQYQTIESSIVPSGVSNWTQLRGWQHPVSKVYRVEFQNIFGGTAGSFDYRISFVPGGSFNGKGKFLGQITVLPMNIQLHTDRTLDVKAELSDPLNFGTETDPVAAAQVVVSWTTPTTTRYQMNSAEYFIYGTGEIEDLTNGTN